MGLFGDFYSSGPIGALRNVGSSANDSLWRNTDHLYPGPDHPDNTRGSGMSILDVLAAIQGITNQRPGRNEYGARRPAIDSMNRVEQGPGLGHHGAGDNIDSMLADLKRKREAAAAENAAKTGRSRNDDYVARWVREAVQPYDGEDGLLAEIQRDADNSVSEVNRVNAGLLAPLEGSKADAAAKRDEIKRTAQGNRRREAAATTESVEDATQALGGDYIGGGNQDVSAAGDMGQVSAAATQAGVNREADLAARDAQEWAGEMQDWARADAAEASKDIRKSEAKLLARARRERAQAANTARNEAYSGLVDMQSAQAEAAGKAQGNQWDALMQIMGLIPKQVDEVVGKDEDGKPITQPTAAFPPALIAALLSGDSNAIAEFIQSSQQKPAQAQASTNPFSALFG